MSPTGVQPADENAEDLLRSAVVDGWFSSLKDLRVVHTDFLARLDAVGPDDPSLLDAVERMHDLGVATGAVLDESPERREAQSLLDFDTLRHLVTAGQDQLIKVWQMQAGVETGKEVTPGSLDAAAFSPDAKFVAETSPDPDPAPGHSRPDGSGAAVVPPAKGGQSKTKDVGPSPEAVTAAFNAPPPTWRVRVWQAKEPARPKTQPGAGRSEPLSNQEVKGWDSPTPVRSLVFSPDGDHLLAVGRPFFMTYGLSAVTFVKQGGYPDAPVPWSNSVGEAPPGLTGNAQRFVLELCDIRSGASQLLKNPQGPTAAAAVAPGGAQVAVSTWGASTTRLDLEAGTKGMTFNTNGPLSVVLSRDGGRAALIDWDHTVKLFGGPKTRRADGRLADRSEPGALAQSRLQIAEAPTGGPTAGTEP